MAASLFERIQSRPDIPIILIILAVIGTLAVNLYVLLIGISIVIPHLLYIPIILAAFFYPRRGVPFAVCLALVYLFMVTVIRIDYPADLISAATRAVVFVVVAAVVSYLSLRLNEEEEQILHAKEEWERTFDAVPDLVALIDREHRILRINKAMAERLGLRSEDATGLHCYEVVHHSKIPPPACPHSMLLHDGKEHTSEFYDENLKGDFLVTAAPLHDPNGKLIGSVHIARDITRRKQTERDLQEKSEELDRFFSVNLDLLCIADTNGNFRRLNPAWEKTLGYTREELMAGRLLDFVHPDDRELTLGAIGRLSEQKQVLNFVNRYRCKDGSYRWIEWRSYPYGNVIYAAARDITERKQAEEALRESEEKFRTLIENLNVGVFRNTADEMGKFLWVNAAQAHMLGYASVDELMGIPVSDLYQNPGDRKRFLTDLKASGVLKDRVIPLKKKDGTQIWVSVNARPKYNDRGEIEWVDGVIEDITDQRALEQEKEHTTKELVRYNEALAQANKKLNILSSVTRHDILNKITVLLAYLELTQEQLKDPVLHEYIQKEIETIQAIQRQIEFTRYYQDIGVRAPEWQDITSTIKRVAAQLPLGGISVTVDLGGVFVFADPLIEKVFYNLIENTIRHGEHVTDIRFFADEFTDFLNIVYEDNGVGIPPENKEKIFQRGFGKHTGLGLFLIREILSITGITITETGEMGKGARFVIRVPKGGYRIS